MNNHLKQINRLIKKELFDKQVKRQKQKKEARKIKIACLFVSVLIILSLSTLFYQLSNHPLATEKKAAGKIAKGALSQETKTGADEEKKSIIKSILPSQNKKTKSETNILVLGRPGDGYSGGNLTDTIILIHLTQDSDSEKAFLISLPRDLLVKIPNGEGLAKMNSLYSLVGIEELKEKVKEITGLSVDRYIIVDLAVVEEIITLVDGLNVFVEQDINDPYFPGPNYSYQAFNLSAGWRYLDGPTTLKYIRTRYTSPNGDFDRMSRQQQVIQLLKQKILALNPLWDFPTYVKIFNSLQGRIDTNLGLLEIKSFWETTKEISSDNIISLVVDKKETGLLTGGQVMFGKQIVSVIYPKAGQGEYEEIKNFIKQAVSVK